MPIKRDRFGRFTSNGTAPKRNRKRREELTDIIMVLDRSGSMSSTRMSTITGFNEFLNSQRNTAGRANLTLLQFDDYFEYVYRGVNINDVPDLNYNTFVPRGMTALYDAIGMAITDTEDRLRRATPRPDKVICVILTDGGENASRDYKRNQIADMISSRRNWEFVFVGANQDAIATARGLNINSSHSMTYAANAAGVGATFESLSKNISNYRSGIVQDAAFEDEDRLKQRKAGA